MEVNEDKLTKAEASDPNPDQMDPRITEVSIAKVRGNGTRAYLADSNNFQYLCNSGWELIPFSVSFCAKVYENVRSICR